MRNTLDPTFVRSQIELLRHTHPQIWDEGDEQLLTDMLEGSTGLHEVLALVVDRMCDAEAFGAGLDLMLATMKARRDRFDDRYEGLRTLALKLMTQAGVRKLELTQATLSIRSGQQKVIITDEAALPPDCIRVRTEPDKIRIKQRLVCGEPTNGAELSNREETLAVRIK